MEIQNLQVLYEFSLALLNSITDSESSESLPWAFKLLDLGSSETRGEKKSAIFTGFVSCWNFSFEDVFSFHFFVVSKRWPLYRIKTSTRSLLLCSNVLFLLLFTHQIGAKFFRQIRDSWNIMSWCKISSEHWWVVVSTIQRNQKHF